jgi:hypothetical protein
MASRYLEEENLQLRSNFIRELVQRSHEQSIIPPLLNKEIPKRIVQFWDDRDSLPNDVNACIDTWRKIEDQGIERLLFDNRQAGDFIFEKLGKRYKQAFDRCFHPAMQSDLFRLCYVFIEGGCYIDADDVYTGSQLLHLFEDGRLKIQPLCYDIATDTMVPPAIFTKPGANDKHWIFYFNNNPLIAYKQHITIGRALDQAVNALEQGFMNGLPDIQSTTGPGNLTKSIFDAITEDSDVENTLVVLSEWENIAISKWPLSYRSDARNWRLANKQEYKTQ